MIGSTAVSRVRSLSGAALSLPKLELLDVSHNQLETIPPAVEQLTALRQLRAQNNSLGVVASELGHCAALEELDVSSNSLVVRHPLTCCQGRSRSGPGMDWNAVKTAVVSR